ncbi:acyl carrier protein [Micromonospora echinospora]
MDQLRGHGHAVTDELERFVRAEGRIEPDDPAFDRGIDLFKGGYLDSLGVVHLVAHIEDRYGIVLTDDELSDPGFVSVDGIGAVVEAAVRRAGLAG